MVTLAGGDQPSRTVFQGCRGRQPVNSTPREHNRHVFFSSNRKNRTPQHVLRPARWLAVLLLVLLCPLSRSWAASPSPEERRDLLPYFAEKELTIANLLATPVDRAPAVAAVVSAPEIKAMGARSLLDVLRRLPGFGVGIASYPVFHTVEVRGVRSLFSEKILLLLDGQRMTSAHTGGATAFLEWFPMEAVKRLEIVRGPGSALHGSDAFLATINLVTKGPDMAGPATVVAAAGSHNSRHLHGSAGSSGEELSWVGYLDLFDTDGPDYHVGQDAAGRSGEPLTWAENRTAGFALQWQDFVLRGGGFRYHIGPYIGANYVMGERSFIEQKNLWALLKWHKKISPSSELTAQFQTLTNDRNPFWELYPEQTIPDYPDGVIGNPRSKDGTVGLSLAFTHQTGTHQTLVGLQSERREQYDVRHIANYNPLTLAPLGTLQDISENLNYNRNIGRTEWAVFFQDIWQFADNLSLTAGVRTDVYSDFGSTTNPRLGLVWQAAPATTIKLLYGTGFRAPVFLELYQDNNPSQQGNPDLQPETISTWELALEHEFALPLTAQVSLYRNDIDDLIVEGEKPSAELPGQYQNAGAISSQGIELELNARPSDFLRCRLAYTYQNAIDEASGGRIPDVPRHRAVFGLDFLGLAPFELHTDLIYTGERPRRPGDSRPPLADSLLTDLTLSTGRLFEHLELRANATNLFDADYRDPSPSALLVPGDYPANGRSFLLEARYSF